MYLYLKEYSKMYLIFIFCGYKIVQKALDAKIDVAPKQYLNVYIYI